MKYSVTARDWHFLGHDGTSLTSRFGEYGSVHELTDTEVVAAIIVFGRASISDATTPYMRDLRFENDYD